MPWYVNGDFNKLFMWTVNLQNPSKQTNKKPHQWDTFLPVKHLIIYNLNFENTYSCA